MVQQRTDYLQVRGKALEALFVRKKDHSLISGEKTQGKVEDLHRELSEISGIKNKTVLQKLVELGITKETMASIVMVPLVEVAWADGNVDGKERESILAGIEKAGISKRSVSYTLLEQWLAERPSPKLLEAWTHYIKGLSESLGKEEEAELEADIMTRARMVAAASGGLFGLTSKISPAEQDMLDTLQSAFRR